MNKRYIAAALPVLLAGTLAAATPGLSQASGGNEPDGAAPKGAPAVAKLAATDPCVGGKQKKAFSGGHAGFFPTTSSATVPGTVWNFNGPRRRKDTVFVTVTAPNTYANPGDTGRVRVLLDGIELAPADTSAEYFYDENNYGSFAGQYCAKVRRGSHQLRVELESIDSDGSGFDQAYLNNAMLHAEVAD